MYLKWWVCHHIVDAFLILNLKVILMNLLTHQVCCHWFFMIMSPMPILEPLHLIMKGCEELCKDWIGLEAITFSMWYPATYNQLNCYLLAIFVRGDMIPLKPSTKFLYNSHSPLNPLNFFTFFKVGQFVVTWILVGYTLLINNVTKVDQLYFYKVILGFIWK